MPALPLELRLGHVVLHGRDLVSRQQRQNRSAWDDDELAGLHGDDRSRAPGVGGHGRAIKDGTASLEIGLSTLDG